MQSCYHDVKKNFTNKIKIKNEDVYQLLQKIPPGSVSTYGDLARALGNPAASRLIGKILGENPNPIRVPCHRVVMSDGRLGGYRDGANKKKELLEKEGLSFINGVVTDFKKIRICPEQKTELETNNCRDTNKLY